MVWLHDNLSYLGVFILIGHCCLTVGDSFLVASNRRRVWGVFWSGRYRWSTASRALTSSSEQRVGDVKPPLACVSYWSLSGFIKGVFQRGEDLSSEEPLFLWRNFSELLLGSVDGDVSNEICLLKDVLWRTCSRSSGMMLDVAAGWMDQIGIICISFQKICRHKIVIEFCITLVRCNQIRI